MARITCSKCKNEREFEVTISSVFTVYVDGDGKTFAKQPLAEACSGIDRVECPVCHSELDDIWYDLEREEAYPCKERDAPAKLVKAV